MKSLQLVNKRTCSFVFLILLFFSFSSNVKSQTKDFTRYVNPFIGTGGHGHTFPGATVPFGMVQLSPDTRIDNWDGSSGYHYSDDVIYGFSHTHLSGTGIPDYCDVLLTPTIDGNDDRTFSHANETATAGFYSVKMNNGILAELTATKRVGLHRYVFPYSKFVNINLDLKWRDKVLDSEVKIVGENRIEGFRRSSSWAKDQIVYFAAEFSEPFASHAIINGVDITEQNERMTQGKGTNLSVSLRFVNPHDKKILVKVAISPTGIEGARKNLETELNHWSFEKVKNDARNAWNKELAKIEVSSGGKAQMTNFYTALYHTMIAPNIFQDADGKYLGLDRKIHDAPKDTNYTVFSLWDTFRAAHPLYTIIDERRTAEFINTFIRQYEQGGRLPVWELAANETDTMIGYHAVSVIADAMAKNIKGFDYEKAFAAAKHSAELDHFGLESYKKRGYISMEDEQESVSKTLEYAYNDYCIAMMARILKKPADYERYIRRARSFENLFDAETGFMRPKQNGGFIKPFAPNDVTFNFTEGNSWQYSFFVPQDVSRLVELHGGNRKFAAKLDELFTTDAKLAGREQPDITGLIGQYAHGNEPSHHIVYLYNYVGEPWKTQKLARRIMDEFYKPTPDGLIGNEDCGQMSAWYVLSASGFYQVNPSQPIYTLGTPLFRETKYNLENGKTFIIKAPDVSAENIYVKSVKLNGKNYRKAFIAHEDITRGGTLEFEMTAAPVKDWFTEFPVSAIRENLVSVPLIESAGRAFTDKTTITLKSAMPEAKILYSLDGAEPRIEYTKPLTIDKTSIVKAASTLPNGEKSLTAEAVFYKKPNSWTVKILSKYNRQYTGGGDEGLIDGIRGTKNFASGEWQGYQAQDFVAVIDLQKETEIKSLGAGFLQDARSWIWMPTRLEFEVSGDGQNFTKIAEIETDVAPQDMESKIRDYVREISPARAQYIRVKAYNLGKIPSWHPGAGNDAFIFIDEILIR
ncbi:MAG TPA: GH92 family glycosyl hydrolase [Pyrinomonadaceae bacterium]|jgi:predicted alpha-1,2-mannosidase